MSRSRKLPNVLRPSESEALLSAAQAAINNARGPKRTAACVRDRMIIFAGLYLGLRVSELVKLRVEDLDLDPQRAAVNVIGGKGDKDRFVPIPGKLLGSLAAWVGDRKTGPVFPGPGGRHLSPRTVQLRILQLGADAGIARRVKPHTLRHSYATTLVDRGADLMLVKDLMGHASISTTQIYLHTSTERLRGAVEKL